MTFEAPDLERFPALALARHALKSGGAAPTILNAANEVAVSHFLARKIGFLDISDVVERTLELAQNGEVANIDDVRAADEEARRIALDVIETEQLR